MMSYQIALIIGAVITAAISWHVKHAAIWIAAGAASFVVSAAYWESGAPSPAAFTAFCDAAICIAILKTWEERWEMRVCRLFQASVLLSIGKESGILDDYFLYSVSLEIINWLALIIIAGTVIFEGSPKWDVFNSGGYSGRFVRFSHNMVFARRRENEQKKRAE